LYHGGEPAEKASRSRKRQEFQRLVCAPPGPHRVGVQALVAILRAAYSGELAAGLAYRGHRKSVRDPGERRRIREIEEEEWQHRARVGDMLAGCGARPSRLREAIFWTIGRVLDALCHATGWLVPMYGAGRLESRNVVEYETAARRAAACGRHEWIDSLLTMAQTDPEARGARNRARTRDPQLGKLRRVSRGVS
jgi:Ubiquinone biosynthesis protein COQ7